jgi:gluconokinase
MGLFNIRRLQWEEPALTYAGISPQQLSTPVPVTYQKVGLSPGLALAMNLPADTPFFIGGSDGTLANLGSLCLSPEEAAITIGTSAAVRITLPQPVNIPDRMIFSYLLDEQTYVCGGATNNGGNVFQWLLKNFFAQHQTVKTYEELFAAIDSVGAGSQGLLFLPYLHGERAPLWDEESRGVFIGLTDKHSLFHMARAAAEGVCFSLNHILLSLEEVCGAVRQITISGGLVQSPPMMQLLADVCGKSVVVLQNEDASAIGAALLAQKATGLIRDYSSVQKKEGRAFEPQPEATSRYQELFPLYQSLYPLLKSTMHSLHRFSR